MEELEKWKNWLMAYPGWEGTLSVDHTGPEYGSCGLFPLGMQVIHRQDDVLGNRYLRCRSTCRLLRMASGQDGAAWLTAFAGWVQQQNASGNVPGLGDVPSRETVSAEKGRLQKRDSGGTDTYCIDLLCEYTRVYPAQ